MKKLKDGMFSARGEIYVYNPETSKICLYCEKFKGTHQRGWCEVWLKDKDGFAYCQRFKRAKEGNE